MVTKICPTCERDHTYEPLLGPGGREMFPPAHCSTCANWMRRKRVILEGVRRLRRREQRWLEVCPPLYRHTDLSLIAEAFHRAAEEWDYSPRGLGLVGAAGLGKTRAAFTILRRMHVLGRSCEAVSATGLGQIALGQFSDDRDKRTRCEKRLDRLHHADLLLIDDLGKGRMTERCEVEFFDLLEHRTAHQLPTIWTANARGDELLALMSIDRGEPILRRLAEFSSVVVGTGRREKFLPENSQLPHEEIGKCPEPRVG